MSHWVSSAPAAHAYLVENIPTAVGIQTFNRSALGTDLENDRIVVGSIQTLEQSWAGLGSLRRDEEYAIHCLVSVYNGNDPTSVDVDAMAAQCWGYVQDVVNLLATDMTLGGVVLWSELKNAEELPLTSPNGGVEFAIAFEIFCRMQITY